MPKNFFFSFLISIGFLMSLSLPIADKVERIMSPPRIPENPFPQERSQSNNAPQTQRKIAAFYHSSEWLNRCSVEIDARINGKTASSVMLFRNDTTYLSTSWTYGLNLTAVAMAKGSPRPVAVTPRHLLSTKHYGWHPWPGQTINFLTMDNRIISRVVDQVKYLGSSDNGTIDKDVAVIRLTEDLPGSITPMKLISPNGLGDVPQYLCPVLRIDQENKALLVQASSYSSQGNFLNFIQPSANNSYNPKGGSYAPYYEGMITGDSSSSSIILYRDQFGVTPFLLSQVTYSMQGMGPNHSGLSAEIQGVIAGFGDTASKYNLTFGPYEYAGNKPPTCSVTASRIATTGNCSISVQGSGDSTNGNPVLLPSGVSSWTKSGNIWTGTAACSTQADTIFTAQLTGPGGTGPTCESGTVKALITLPGCSMTASRQGSTNNCNLSITRTQGRVSGNPTVTPTSPTTWNQSGDAWTGSTTCSQVSNTTFSATLSGPDGTGLACTATVAPVPKPACALTLSRQGTTATCNVSVTRSQGDATGNPILAPNNASDWNRVGEVWSGSTSCATATNTIFTATISGPGGPSDACTALMPAVAPPSCTLSASRNSNSGVCQLILNTGGTVDTSLSPVMNPTASGTWAGNRWTGTGNCPVNTSTTFAATVNGPNSTSASCQSAPINAVPPACNLSVVRNGTSSTCTYTLTSTSPAGTINKVISTRNGSSFYRDGFTWNNAVNSSQSFSDFPCAANASFDFNAIVEGPGGQNSCASARVAPVPAPACSITASREGSTTQCNLTIRRTGGVATGNPSVTPASPSTWTTTTDTWTGKATCSASSSTVFTATLSGPGGTGAACSANAVPSLNVAPTCRMSAQRIETSSVCSIGVTIYGQYSQAPRVSPSPTTKWTQSGNEWSARASCPAGRITSFNAAVKGPYGTGYCGVGIK